MLRTSALPNEVVMVAEPASLRVTVPLPPVMVAAPCTCRTVMLPKRLRRSSAPFTSEACTEPLLSLMKVSPEAPASSMLPKELFRRAGPSVANRQRSVAVVDIGFAAHAVDGDVAEAVFDDERCVGGNRDVVVDRVRSVFANVKPLLLVVRIDGANAHSVSDLLHVDLYFLRVGFGFLARTGLHPDGRGDFNLAARFAVNTDFAEFVFNPERLRRGREAAFSENRARPAPGRDSRGPLVSRRKRTRSSGAGECD